MAEKSEPTDLFGLPVLEPKDRRGRKAHRRDLEVSKKITISRAMGRTEEQIATIVGLDPKTLRKYYSRELEKAVELVEAILDEAIFEGAIIDKKASSQRLLRERLDRGKAAVPLAPSARRAQVKPKATAGERMGKKAQATVDAKTAHEGGSWATVLKPH